MRDPDGVTAWRHVEIRYSCPGCTAERVVDEERGEQVCDRCGRVAIVEDVRAAKSPQTEIDLCAAQLEPHMRALHRQRRALLVNGRNARDLEVLVPIRYRAAFEGSHVFGLPIRRADVVVPQVRVKGRPL